MRSRIRVIVQIIMSGIILMFVICLISCENHIIQRAGSDYFQYETGNWWQLIGTSDTMYIEVESTDTIAQTEVIPVSFNGHARFVFFDDEALYEHVAVTYMFSGSEYPVIDNFIARIELPLVNDNIWHDSLVGSIEVAGQDIRAQHDVWGSIIDCHYNTAYEGDVYSIEITTQTLLVTPDTTIIDSSCTIEEFAPGLGIVRFQDATGEYLLIDYLVQ